MIGGCLIFRLDAVASVTSRLYAGTTRWPRNPIQRRLQRSMNPHSDPPAAGLTAEQSSVTAVLNDATSSRAAIDRVFGMVYTELKRIAGRVLGPESAATLNPTVLVHEVYAKLIGSAELAVGGRQHFYALCARTMRQIVVDHARGKLADKRGGGAKAVELTDSGAIDLAQPESMVALDLALQRLAERDQRLVDLIQYRVFAGMDLAEIAPMLEVTVRQLQRDWQRARIWLTEALLESQN